MNIFLRVLGFCVFGLSICAFDSIATTMSCSGDLPLQSRAGKLIPFSQSVTSSESTSFKIIDQNSREIAQVWPWNSIQVRPILNAFESKQRGLEIQTNGMSWFSVSVASTSASKVEKIFCEIEE